MSGYNNTAGWISPPLPIRRSHCMITVNVQVTAADDAKSEHVDSCYLQWSHCQWQCLEEMRKWVELGREL